MRTQKIVFGCLVIWGAVAGARGDGFVVPGAGVAYAKMKIPDQRALIQFADGNETLVIDTAFKGDGTNFAWVVPLPSKPEVEPTTEGLFTTLQFLFQPVVYHEIPLVPFLILFIGIFLVFTVRQVRRSVGVVKALAEGILLMFGIVFLAGLLLGAGGPAETAPLPDKGVCVVERKQAGIYDTAVLRSADGSALLEWLNRNGFATPTNHLAVIQSYARQGWYFVASRVRVDAPLTDAAQPQPLAFTFKTERAVYPLRLTGINNPHCKIDLYVFGSQRATATNFIVERSEKPVYTESVSQDDYNSKKTEALVIGHPLLKQFAANSLVATKLSGDPTSA